MFARIFASFLVLLALAACSDDDSAPQAASAIKASAASTPDSGPTQKPTSQSGLTILGLSLGMTLAEVEAAAKAHGYEYIIPSYTSKDSFSLTKFFPETNESSEACNGIKASDSLASSPKENTIEPIYEQNGAVLEFRCHFQDVSLQIEAEGVVIEFKQGKLSGVVFPDATLQIDGDAEAASKALADKFGLDFEPSMQGSSVAYKAETSSSVPGFKTVIEANSSTVELNLVPVPNFN